MKTAKVTMVNGDPKPYTNANGTTYYHNLTMDNGDEINIGKKKVVNVGDELTYELTGGDDGQQKFKKAKSAQPQNNHSGGNSQKTWTDNSDAILYQTCLKAVSENFATRGNTVVEFSIQDVDRIATLALHLAKVSKQNIETLKNG